MAGGILDSGMSPDGFGLGSAMMGGGSPDVTLPMQSVGPVTTPIPTMVGAAPSGPLTDQQALINTANQLGISPVDLATVIHYESGFRPNAINPDGIHTGLIQFGRTEQRDYGVNKNQSFQDQLPAVAAFLQDRGFKPSMGFLDLYSTINAGSPGKYNAVDGSTNVSQKVASMDKNRAAAAAWLAKDPSVSGGTTAGFGNPSIGPSMGSTMQQGGFGLNGIVGMGQAVAGQSSINPALAGLSDQPMTTMGSPSSSMLPSGMAGGAAAALTQQAQSPYGGLMNQLQGAAGALGKAGQQGQQKSGGGGMQMGQPYKPNAIGLQQAKALFDPARFYQALQAAGIRTGGNQ